MTTLKELQKTIAAYNNDGQSKKSKTFMVDVYCDRIVVIVPNSQYLGSFFQNRGISSIYDRGGMSVCISDGQKIGLNLESGSHTFQYADLRKKP